MSDNSDNTGPEDGNGSEAAPDSPATPQAMPGGHFIIRNQYLKDLSFENPNAPEVLVSLKAAPSVEVDINLNVNPMPDIDERTFEVEMRLRVEAKAEEKPAFICELTYAGLFSIGQVPEDAVRPLLLIECPRMLFPFARAILGNATRDGGYPPLMLQPIDFAEFYARNMAPIPEPAGNA